MTTYSSFAAPKQLLRKIIQCFDCPDKIDSQTATVVKLRCANMLKHWIELSFADFDQQMIGDVEKLIQQLANSDQHQTSAAVIQKALCRVIFVLNSNSF